jgi:hypothetical protein
LLVEQPLAISSIDIAIVVIVNFFIGSLSLTGAACRAGAGHSHEIGLDAFPLVDFREYQLDLFAALALRQIVSNENY